MPQKFANTLFHNFLGSAPQWYKLTIITFLIFNNSFKQLINPIIVAVEEPSPTPVGSVEYVPTVILFFIEIISWGKETIENERCYLC